ncbi:AraC family transcriptional regulator [Roseococcus sp. DSY-14]|uniref:AraC family transcriptional regulator n=1 Tax=Roseococcus sp. DSY-14 TaxID=3369650 RepID=UPI00387B7CC1
MIPVPAPTDPGGSLGLFTITRCSDPAELDCRSRMSDRLPGQSREYRYTLQDRSILGARFASPIVSVAIRTAGAFVISYGESRFATEVGFVGEESDVFGFSFPSRGVMTLVRQGEPQTADAGKGLVYRLGAARYLVTGDDSARTNVFIKAAEVERALEEALDHRLRTPLSFDPVYDTNSGLAASLTSQLDLLFREAKRADGLASNPVALASMTDLLVTLMLRGAPNNYSGILSAGSGAAVPAYVFRAEEYMRANCAAPIRVSDIAGAAGCSVRTLNATFLRFRGQVPLAALCAIRLKQVHAELGSAREGTTIAAIARRYGFTNASRFNAAFRRRFGEAPRDVVRRELRRQASS